jgi:hypothetical protein
MIRTQIDKAETSPGSSGAFLYLLLTILPK